MVRLTRALALSLAGPLLARAALAQSSVPRTGASKVARSMADVCTDCRATEFSGYGKFLERH